MQIEHQLVRLQACSRLRGDALVLCELSVSAPFHIGHVMTACMCPHAGRRVSDELQQNMTSFSFVGQLNAAAPAAGAAAGSASSQRADWLPSRLAAPQVTAVFSPGQGGGVGFTFCSRLGLDTNSAIANRHARVPQQSAKERDVRPSCPMKFQGDDKYIKPGW